MEVRMVETEELLTAEELAVCLKVKIPTVRKWQLQGVPAELIGRLRRYRLAPVME